MEYTPPHERIRSENEVRNSRAKEESQRLAKQQEVQMQRIFSAVDAIGENQMNSVIEVLEEVKAEKTKKRGKISSFFLPAMASPKTFDIEEYTGGNSYGGYYDLGRVKDNCRAASHIPKQFRVAEVVGGFVVPRFFFEADKSGDQADYIAPLVVASDGRLWNEVFKSLGDNNIYGVAAEPFLTRAGLSYEPKGAALDKIVQELEQRV